ncbi:hypothetical protein BDZ45DRAFT_284666 [Acephala macrosclerotiorum]|nr:hypothetical protein BDZ45DRAFT_284666 [Acephala macrosclerotiorum]
MRFGLRLFSTGTNGTLVAISTTLLMPQAPQSPNPFVGISAVLSKLFVKSVLCVRSRVVKTRPSKISWTILPCRLLYSFASRKSFHFLLPLLSYPHYPTSLQHFRQCGVFKNFWHMLAPSFKKVSFSQNLISLFHTITFK